MTAAQEIEKLYGDYIEQYRQQNSGRKPGQGIFGMGPGPGDLPCHGQLLENLKALLADIAGREAGPCELRQALEVVFREPVQLQHEAPAAYWTLLAAHGAVLELIEGIGGDDAAALYEEYKRAYPRSKRLPVQKQVLDALGKRAKRK